MTIYQDLGLQRIINASGRMTALGVSVASEQTSRAMQDASRNYVDIADLIDVAGKKISAYTGAEDSCPTVGAAAGIAIAVAACIARESITITQQLPQTEGIPNEVILQKGHSINFGASVPQMIALGGGKVLEVGSANHVLASQVKDAIGPKTVALLYVVSHHCVQKGMLSITTMASIAKEKKVPLIIDAAAEEDLKKYVAFGADLVIYSGAKAIEGPISGFITGRAELVASCKMQNYGIARSMKIGKEGIVGLLAALDVYHNKELQTIKKLEKEKVSYLYESLSLLEALSCSIEKDPAGRDITRLRIRLLPEKTSLSCEDFIKELESGNVSIRTRNHLANIGIIEIDPRPLLDDEEKIIVEKIVRILENHE